MPFLSAGMEDKQINNIRISDCALKSNDDGRDVEPFRRDAQARGPRGDGIRQTGEREEGGAQASRRRSLPLDA